MYGHFVSQVNWKKKKKRVQSREGSEEERKISPVELQAQIQLKLEKYNKNLALWTLGLVDLTF